MEKKILIICFCIFMILSCTQGVPANGCRDQPADIVFVLDSSSSIWPPDFMRQIHFVENVTSEFNIGQANDQSRVSVMSFSNTKHVEFHLKDTSGVKNIWKIPYRTGGTNTAVALDFLATDMYKVENGGRPDVPHIAIVITDGQSWDRDATNLAANHAREQGIQIFAIGVGRGVNMDELRDISSDPDERFVFNVTSYRDLQTIKQSLTKRTCEAVTRAPVNIKRTTPAYTESTSTEKLQADRETLTKACGGKPADVYFLLDSSSSIRPTDFNKQLGFVRDLVDIFDIAPNKTRVGVSTFSHEYQSVISLDQYAHKEDMVNSITRIPYLRGGTDTGAALEKVRTIDFSPSKTRQEVAHILIVMTDGLSRNPDSTAIQANLAKSGGTYVFAIGIGENADRDELRNIASAPDSTVSNFVFSVDNFDALDTIKSVLAISTCEVAGYQQDQGACRVPGSTDVMFVYDSARFGYEKSTLVMETVYKLATFFEQQTNGNIQTGVLSSSCIDNVRDIALGAALLQSEYDYFSNAGYNGVQGLVRKLRIEGYSPSNGGRRGAVKKAIVFVDAALSRDEEREIKRAGFQKVEFVFVAIGDKADVRQLQGLTRQKVIQVPSLQNLFFIRRQISEIICKSNMS